MIATIAPRGHYAEAVGPAARRRPLRGERRHHGVRQRHDDRARAAGRAGARHDGRPGRHQAVRHRRHRVRHRRVRLRGHRRRRARPAPGGAAAARQDPRRGRRPARPPVRRAAHLGRLGASASTPPTASPLAEIAARRPRPHRARAPTTAPRGRWRSTCTRSASPSTRRPARSPILRSIQAVDAGTVLHPEQLRGQVEGGVGQAIGTALFEEIRLDDEGRVTTASFRAYHVPQMIDLPRTEVLFAQTTDDLGPLGAKSMSEAPVQPGRPGPGQRDPRRPRRPPPRAPDVRRPPLAPGQPAH